MSWLDRLLGRGGTSMRVAGEPPSGNGASSFHLWWEVPFGERLKEVGATLEVLDPPEIDRLYFWALQVSFIKPDGGGAHLGLQHHPRFPAQSAANWGGYAPPDVGGLLTGSTSPLPSTPNDVNTRDFLWYPNRPYRLTIGRSPDAAPSGFHAWRGTIEDLHAEDFTVVRDLYSRGEYLRGPVVWTESFARCDHPSAAVRWSNLHVVGEDDQTIPVTTVSPNYQDRSAGGCDNTDVSVDAGGWIQRTNTSRTARGGFPLTTPRTV